MIFTKQEFLKLPLQFQTDGAGEINLHESLPRVFIVADFNQLKEILNKNDLRSPMDDPVLSPYPFIYFTCDRDPTPTDSTYSGYPGLIYFWYNTTSMNIFCCVNCDTESDLIWQEMVMPQNILSILSAQGWKVNTARSYVSRSSPAFSTSYSPSVTNDTQVVTVISLTSTLLTSAEVTFQVNTGSGFVTICEESLSGLAATSVRTVNFTAPAGSSYQLINNSGTASITQIMELTQ